jgi:hypothetical protein
MPDIRRGGPPQAAPIPDARLTRSAVKKARIAAIATARRLPRARVLPTSEALRQVLRHPHGMAFRSTGSVEWPFDKYTQRRVRDGSITIESMVEPRSPPSHPGGFEKSAAPDPAPKQT